MWINGTIREVRSDGKCLVFIGTASNTGQPILEVCENTHIVEESKNIPEKFKGEYIYTHADVKGYDAGKVEIERRKKAKEDYEKKLKAKKDKQQAELKQLQYDQMKLNTHEKVTLSTKVRQLDSDETLTLR